MTQELRAHSAAEGIVTFAARPVGIVNYYAGFRNIARTWLQDHRDEVWSIVCAVAEATDDATVRSAYAAIDPLPALPRPGAGDGQPGNLVTPLLACLDPRGRAPIINGQKVWLLRKLRLASSSLGEQHDGLVGLLGQAGINDAFDLDVADEAKIDEAMKRAPRRTTPARRQNARAQGLAERHDEDVEYLMAANTVRMRRLHNTMTNALRAFCTRSGLTIEEGSEQTCLFDALIRTYFGHERHLLIEAKTDDAMPMCRMAVGQLLDYRRRLGDRAAIDLAVLFPKKPSRDALDLFAFVGVKVMWFDASMRNVQGQVRLGSRG